jgi:prephenate dehydratase
MRLGYFGPEGTFTHEALIEAVEAGVLDRAPRAHDAPEREATPRAPRRQEATELVPLPTIYETVMAVETGVVDRALVPIENSLEGSVNATLDALALETDQVEIVGEVVHPIRHCLIARTEIALDQIETVVSHPQATAQCARFIRTRLPQAQVLGGSSTAEAVRLVAEHEGPWAALGNRLAAERYGCHVLMAGVEDVPDNETRFVWLARADEGAADEADEADEGAHEEAGEQAGGATAQAEEAGSTASPWKTAIVFWGAGSEYPGWLVSCLSEFASREVNLTRIESRPRKRGLGSYMFFLDLEGRESDPAVHSALAGLREHVEILRVLGSFPLSPAVVRPVPI